MSIQSRIGLGFDLQEMELYRFMNYQTPVKFDFKAPYIVIAGSIILRSLGEKLIIY